jgi:predicted nucleic acid-binding protein
MLATGQRLLAPTLIRVEVAAAITRKVRHGVLPATEVAGKVQQWGKVLAHGYVRMVPDEELLVEAAVLSAALLHPLQDCLYLALAQSRSLPLITADRRFRDKALGSYSAIQMLPGCEAM